MVAFLKVGQPRPLINLFWSFCTNQVASVGIELGARTLTTRPPPRPQNGGFLTCGSTQISVMILSSPSSLVATSSASSSDDDTDEHDTSEMGVDVYGGNKTYWKSTSDIKATKPFSQTNKVINPRGSSSGVVLGAANWRENKRKLKRSRVRPPARANLKKRERILSKVNSNEVSL